MRSSESRSEAIGKNSLVRDAGFIDMWFRPRRRDNHPDAQKNAIAMARAEGNALQNE
jgi:hypothetical protein